ncbi:hypothetical protein [Actinomadura terrae]|uniref:hypothetical protein n=1 Tax=Actinomadura terrae TaxID=604353 RepID=UPI001FA7FBAC|nr:hypothetical protein [Actinomadura terrae]
MSQGKQRQINPDASPEGQAFARFLCELRDTRYLSTEAVRKLAGIGDRTPLNDCFLGYVLPCDDFLGYFILKVLDKARRLTDEEGTELDRLYRDAVAAAKPAVTPLDKLGASLRAKLYEHRADRHLQLAEGYQRKSEIHQRQAEIFQRLRTEDHQAFERAREEARALSAQALGVVDELDSTLAAVFHDGIERGEDFEHAADLQIQHLAAVPAQWRRVEDAWQAKIDAAVQHERTQAQSRFEEYEEQIKQHQALQDAANQRAASLGIALQRVRAHNEQILDQLGQERSELRLWQSQDAFGRVSDLRDIAASHDGIPASDLPPSLVMAGAPAPSEHQVHRAPPPQLRAHSPKPPPPAVPLEKSRQRRSSKMRRLVASIFKRPSSPLSND